MAERQRSGSEKLGVKKRSAMEKRGTTSASLQNSFCSGVLKWREGRESGFYPGLQWTLTVDVWNWMWPQGVDRNVLCLWNMAATLIWVRLVSKNGDDKTECMDVVVWNYSQR